MEKNRFETTHTYKTSMNKKIILMAALAMATVCTRAQARPVKVFEARMYGIKPDTGKNTSPLMAKFIQKVKDSVAEGDSVVIRLEKGRYDFFEKGALAREYYISNHDQDNPKMVGVALEDMKHVLLDGQGAQLVFHGRMLPLSVLRTENCTVSSLSIDFEHPHISQVKIVENDAEKGILFEPAPWVKYRCKDGRFEAYDEGWAVTYGFGFAFDGDTRHVVYNTGDISIPLEGAEETEPGLIRAPKWKDARLKPGTVAVFRVGSRPAPGLFLSHNVNTVLSQVKVHYAEGMGLLAQLCENIKLSHFGVCLKGVDDPRFFSTQADATHFSGCKGRIESVDGLYEGMMDDAINVHGTYLKVVRRIDDRTVVGRYMHGQSWGFEWGRPGDEVQVLRSRTMETLGEAVRIASIRPADRDTILGAREFQITFDKPIDQCVSEAEGFGLENLTWTPEVLFARNIVRNNRARGALFSTPRKTVVEDNFFDHTSGSAILLCGDCNGWYETGACRDVVIRRNHFLNALTSQYQFTTAVISIYPEIPDLAAQHQYFHGGPGGGIVIEDNEFDMFDMPVLYAKSVDGLVFRRNVIRTNHAFKPFHYNQNRFLLEHVTNVKISE